MLKARIRNTGVQVEESEWGHVNEAVLLVLKRSEGEYKMAQAGASCQGQKDLDAPLRMRGGGRKAARPENPNFEDGPSCDKCENGGHTSQVKGCIDFLAQRHGSKLLIS